MMIQTRETCFQKVPLDPLILRMTIPGAFLLPTCMCRLDNIWYPNFARKLDGLSMQYVLSAGLHPANKGEDTFIEALFPTIRIKTFFI